MGTGEDVSTVVNLCIHFLQQDVIENANFCPAAFAETFKILKLPVQPRDPCRPWRGTLASGHKPR